MINEKVEFKKLISRIANKENSAFEEFYNLYGRLIQSAALATTRDTFMADEVVNDILLKIWQQAPSIEGIKRPRSWIYTITANHAKNLIKRTKEYVDIFDTDIPVNFKATDEILEESAFIYRLRNLNEKEKQIMIFRFVEDMTFKEIAYEVKEPLGNITVTYCRALEKIRKNLIE